MTYLVDTSLYMNPATGSVDTGTNWSIDFDARDDQDQSWEAWGGDSLIEVVECDEEDGVEFDNKFYKEA